MTRDSLIERLAGAFRARDPHGQIRYDPAFFDLGEADRAEAARRASIQRHLEAALDPDGLSTTSRAILARIQSN